MSESAAGVPDAGVAVSPAAPKRLMTTGASHRHTNGGVSRHDWRERGVLSLWGVVQGWGHDGPRRRTKRSPAPSSQKEQGGGRTSLTDILAAGARVTSASVVGKALLLPVSGCQPKPPALKQRTQPRRTLSPSPSSTWCVCDGQVW